MIRIEKIKMINRRYNIDFWFSKRKRSSKSIIFIIIIIVIVIIIFIIIIIARMIENGLSKNDYYFTKHFPSYTRYGTDIGHFN